MKAIKIAGYLLIPVILFLSYFLYASIREPVLQQENIERVEAQVIAKLEKLRDLEVLYADVHDHYANKFEELQRFIAKDTIYTIERIEKQAGVGDSVQITYDTLAAVAVRDTIFKMYPDLDVANLSKIPGSGKDFEIFSGYLRNKKDFRIPVFEIKDVAPVDPERITGRRNKKPLQVGDKYEATTSGNWQ